ncbi:MAG: translation initiation factor IF-2 [Saprospiraceae bacterium]|nr:translation initiation factor IF-2 [Saprospiraceae bacterium]
MAKNLVKTASEFNIGTSSIVEHLQKKGFAIENKPNAKITDEMFAELIKEFSASMAVKEKAEQLIIGKASATQSPKREIPSIPTPPPPPAPIAPVVEAKSIPTPTTPVPTPTTTISEPTTAADSVITRVTVDAPKITVVDKIDLEAKKKKKPTDKVPEIEDVKEPYTPEPKVVESSKIIAPVTSTEEPVQEMHRSETPTLKGLKILGKIDTDKFSKKKKEEPVADLDSKKKPLASSDEDIRKKRKRKRKKIESTAPPPSGTPGTGVRPARGRDDVKEISQKEIDDQIRATLARLGSNTKSRRQKIRRDNRSRIREKIELEEQALVSTDMQVTEFMSVSELASLLNVKPAQVIMTCMNLGVIVSINQRLDAEIIELVAEEFGHKVSFVSAEDSTDTEEDVEDLPSDLVPRAPIVTVMGHVDHGKTSLLDYIRSANVVSGEAGGITQHIGAYEVKLGDKQITFLDTPGHEAFTAMRARGTKMTDVVIIIIAADDNIMPQTKEAISHAQAAGVPIVFAINKIDKQGANPEKIKQELAAMNLMVEDWGGKIQSQDISAKTGLNVDKLMEKILLEAEILQLTANPKRMASGTVIEASLDKGRGYVTKLLVQNGSLNVGDAILAGEHFGRVKAMFNEWGQKITIADPSSPVLILGMSGAPQAGEKFKVFEDESIAKDLGLKRAQINRELATRTNKRISLDEIGRRLALGTFKELKIIIKGDVDGSIEALADSLIKLSIEKIQVSVIHKAVGGITESDVLLASASDAIIIGFQVRPSASARKLAEKEGVEIKTFSIIYEAIAVIRSAMEGMMEPVKEEKVIAMLEVREVFKITGVGSIAGCFVTEGKIMKNTPIRLIRDGIVTYPSKEGATAKIAALKRFKDDVKEVKSGLECGLSIENFNDIKTGDVIEGYEISEVKARLS